MVMMEYILGRIISWNVEYEKITDKAIRVYGNFDGFSVIREAYGIWIEADGRIMCRDEFEEWLYNIKKYVN